MITDNQSVLELNNLPPRAEKLSHSAMQKVFGGCSDSSCGKHTDCCDNNKSCDLIINRCVLNVNNEP